MHSDETNRIESLLSRLCELQERNLGKAEEMLAQIIGMFAKVSEDADRPLVAVFTAPQLHDLLLVQAAETRIPSKARTLKILAQHLEPDRIYKLHLQSLLALQDPPDFRDELLQHSCATVP